MSAAKILQKVLCICGSGSIAFLNILASLLFVFPSYSQDTQNDPHATGLILPTPKEIAAFKKTHNKVVKVLPNKIALERANKERAKKGLPQLPEEEIAPYGKEVISSRDGGVPDTEDIVTQELSSIDNSTDAAFPVIRSQGGLGSCASFAITYYHLTYSTLAFKAAVASRSSIASHFWTGNRTYLVSRGVRIQIVRIPLTYILP